MKIRRLFCVFATLLVAASSFAQFTKEQKDEVLTEMGRVLTKDAFVPGVDLGKWRTFIDGRKAKIDGAETPGEFANVVNGALEEFGLSHIMLLRDRTRRHWGGDEPESAQQRFGFRRRMPEMGWIEDDAALIRIPSFEGTYDPDSVAALFDQAKDAKYMVIDLRGNPGGEVENMRQFLGLVMKADSSVGTFVSRKMAEDYTQSKGAGTDPVAIAKWAHREFHPTSSDVEPFKGKIAVLVDSGSASAAEIVANALHEVRHSPIIGSKTAGAVLVSTFDRLSYGFRLQFPIGDYVSHDGMRLEGHPLMPDINADRNDPNSAITAALSRLKTAAQ